MKVTKADLTELVERTEGLKVAKSGETGHTLYSPSGRLGMASLCR